MAKTRRMQHQQLAQGRLTALQTSTGFHRTQIIPLVIGKLLGWSTAPRDARVGSRRNRGLRLVSARRDDCAL